MTVSRTVSPYGFPFMHSCKDTCLVFIYRPAQSPLYLLFCLTASALCPLFFYVQSILLFLWTSSTPLDARQNHCNISLDVSISNECGLLQTWWSQLGGFVDEKGPARDHERDIVQYGPYSSFVDKWIFMLINSDSDMSENCGECGIILTPRPYTWTTVVSSVCGLALCCSKLFLFECKIQLGTILTVNATNVHHTWSQLYPCGKIWLNPSLLHYNISYILYNT